MSHCLTKHHVAELENILLPALARVRALLASDCSGPHKGADDAVGLDAAAPTSSVACPTEGCTGEDTHFSKCCFGTRVRLTAQGDKWEGANKRFTFTLQSSPGIVGRVYTIKAVTTDGASTTFLGSERTLAEDWSEGSPTEFQNFTQPPSSSWVALFGSSSGDPVKGADGYGPKPATPKSKGTGDLYATIWYDPEIPVECHGCDWRSWGICQNSSTKACSQPTDDGKCPDGMTFCF